MSSSANRQIALRWPRVMPSKRHLVPALASTGAFSAIQHSRATQATAWAETCTEDAADAGLVSNRTSLNFTTIDT